MSDETNISCARLRKKIEDTPKPDSAKLLRDSLKESGFIYACQMARLAAGHEVNLIWNEPRLAKPQSKMKAIKQKAVKDALFRHNGNIRRVSIELGISRATIYSMIKCVVLFVSLAAIVGCKTPSSVSVTTDIKPQVRLAMPVPPSPKDAQRSALRVVLVAPANTNGMIHLEWNSGNPPETIIENLTTGLTLDCGTNTSATIKGLTPGSFNTIIARNYAGSRELLAATAVTNWPGLFPVVSDYSFRVYWTNGVLQLSTNLVTWKTHQSTSPATVTNKGSVFFRSYTANTNLPFERIRIVPHQSLLTWQVQTGQSQRLQIRVNAATESYSDVATFTATNSGLFGTLTTKRGLYRVLQ